MKHFYFLTLLLLLGMQHPIYAQQLDTLEAFHTLQQASTCESTQNWDSTLVYLRRAVIVFGAANYWDHWVDCQNRIGKALCLTGQREAGKAHLETALEVGIRELGDKADFHSHWPQPLDPSTP